MYDRTYGSFRPDCADVCHNHTANASYIDPHVLKAEVLIACNWKNKQHFFPLSGTLTKPGVMQRNTKQEQWNCKTGLLQSYSPSLKVLYLHSKVSCLFLSMGWERYFYVSHSLLPWQTMLSNASAVECPSGSSCTMWGWVLSLWLGTMLCRGALRQCGIHTDLQIYATHIHTSVFNT